MCVRVRYELPAEVIFRALLSFCHRVFPYISADLLTLTRLAFLHHNFTCCLAAPRPEATHLCTLADSHSLFLTCFLSVWALHSHFLKCLSLTLLWGLGSALAVTCSLTGSQHMLMHKQWLTNKIFHSYHTKFCKPSKPRYISGTWLSRGLKT